MMSHNSNSQKVSKILEKVDRNVLTGVLAQVGEVSLNGFLESTDGGRLESKVGLEVLSDLTDDTLEGELSD